VSPLSGRLRLLSPILATLLLAALFAPPAQAGNNLNMPPAPASGSAQEPIRAEGSAGTDKTTAENASSESTSSRAGAAGNQQETVREAAGTQQHAQNPPNFSQHPDAIICTLPGAQPRRIAVPDGRNPTDFCPASRTTARIYHHDPGVSYTLPKSSGGPPPPDWADIEKQLNKDAQMQLDNLAAAKLRNKTPGQQTPEKLP